MSMSIAIDDERALSKEMFVLVAGGTAAGVSAAGLSLIAGEYVPQLMVLAFAAVVGLFANYSDRRSERGHFRLGLSIVSGIVWALLLLVVDPVWAAGVGGVILGASLSMKEDDGTHVSRVRQVGVWALYGVGLALAVLTTQTFLNDGFLRAVQFTVVPELVMGTVWGVFLSAAAVSSRVQIKRDLMVGDYRRAISEVGIAERTLLSQALRVYTQIMEELRRSEHREFVEVAVPVADEISRNLLQLARKTDALRRSNVTDDFLYLEARIAQTDEQIKRAGGDEALVRELYGVRQELETQLGARRDLRAACARFEARQNRCLTSLERLQVALIQNSALASMEQVDLQEALQNLQNLADDITWRGTWEGEEKLASSAVLEELEACVLDAQVPVQYFSNSPVSEQEDSGYPPSVR